MSARYDVQIALQRAAFAAVAAARNWAPGEIAFQGGSALHFVYRSPRRSEDLDFLVDERVDLRDLAGTVHAALARSACFDDLQMRVKDKPSVDAPSDRPLPSPRVFTFATPLPDRAGNVLVKMDFWPAPRGGDRPDRDDPTSRSFDRNAARTLRRQGLCAGRASLFSAARRFRSGLAVGARRRGRDQAGRYPSPLRALPQSARRNLA